MKFFPGRSLPVFLGFALVIVGTIITLLLVKQGNVFNIGATPSEDPQDLRITNISDGSFTVTYTTNATVLGTLNYSDNSVKLDNVVLDDRDQLNQTVNKYSVHSITVRGLKADSTYFFQINSGDKKFTNGDSPYSVETGGTIQSDPVVQNPITGKVLGEAGKPPTEALVYVKTNGAEDLSTLTKQDGSYTIPLNSLRSQTLDEYYEIPADTIFSIEAKDGNSSAQASTSLQGINPVPPITLSQAYDFSSTQIAASVSNPSSSSFPKVGEKSAISPSPGIQNLTESPSPIETITPMPTLTVSPTETVVAENISPTPSQDIQPIIPPTGNSSVIMGSIFGSVLVVFGIILFLSTGRKIPL
jgi:hypothetical protein